jgi:hypothetical protein
MEIKGKTSAPAPAADQPQGGQHHVLQPVPPDPNAKLTGEQQSGLDRFRRIEARDEQTAYAWLGAHSRKDSPMDYAYQALMLTQGVKVINSYFNKYGQLGKGAAFGPYGGPRGQHWAMQGWVWAYHPSDNGGDFAGWEQTFDHSSITLPPPNISAVVVDVQ